MGTSGNTDVPGMGVPDSVRQGGEHKEKTGRKAGIGNRTNDTVLKSGQKGETMTDNLIYIPIEELYPHPDNPRKDVGDVSELAASIKESGVLQNLTVVPGHAGQSRNLNS